MATSKDYNSARIDALSDFGDNSAEFRDTLTGVEKPLGDFIKRVADNITSKDLVDSGAILSMEIRRVDESNIQMLGVPYILYLDLGIKGSESSSKAPNSPFKMTRMPPIDSFVDWIKSKNIRIRNNPSYGGSNDSIVDDDRIEQVAYAMALERFKKGYSPQNIFNKEIEQLIDEASESIADNIAFTFIDSLPDGNLNSNR